MADNRITYGEWRKAWQLKVILGHYHETYEESPRLQDMYVRLWPDSVDIKFLRLDMKSPKFENMLEQVVSFKTAEYIVSWEPKLSSTDIPDTIYTGKSDAEEISDEERERLAASMRAVVEMQPLVEQLIVQTGEYISSLWKQTWYEWMASGGGT